MTKECEQAIKKNNKPSESVTKPSYYDHPAGISCIDVIQHYMCNQANIIKYAMRLGKKDNPLHELGKIIEYAGFEMLRILGFDLYMELREGELSEEIKELRESVTRWYGEFCEELNQMEGGAE